MTQIDNPRDRSVQTHSANDKPVRDENLQAVAREAARIFGAPAALAGVLLPDREKIIASHGWELAELPLPVSFAARVRQAGSLLVADSAGLDPRLRDHPLVTSGPQIQFFCGVPVTEGGNVVGALYTLDRQPRVASAAQTGMLEYLGEQVARELARQRERAAAEETIETLRDLLAASEGRFRDFFEQTDDLVLSIAPDGRLLHGNEATVQAFGISKEELSRTPLVRLADPEAREQFREALAAVFDSGESQRVETVFVTAGGRRMTVDGIFRPQLVDGRAVLARVIFRDVSERKEFEAELGNARDAALEAARLKTQFLTNVSHEIRTPMNGIVGMIDLLLASNLNAEQSDFAHQARASAEHLLSIVNNILHVSSLEAGRLSVANTDFDLRRTLERIVEVMQVAALGKDLTVSFQYDDKLPSILRGNRSRIAQIATNLLENAIKFTERGTVSLSVFLQTETETHRVIRFEIRDSGIGIAPEDRLLLFERFSQIDASSTRKYEGIGLGLAAARHLVDTLGGLIDVESTPGEGSMFWFSIPFPKQSSARTPIVSSDLEFRGKRVLLVNHARSAARILRHYLEVSWEMRVSEAETAAQALAILRRESDAHDPVQLLVVDTFPDRTLDDVMRELRLDPQLSETRVVQLAGAASPPNEERMRALGIVASVSQPVGQSELFDAIAVALAREALAKPKPAINAAAAAAPRALVVTPEMKANLRILLAEDNFLNRKLTVSQLEKLGYNATTAANGKEVVDLMLKEPFDVVLMDCQMPVMDGYDATLEIRRRERSGGRRSHIIAMTANAREGDREKCLASGMDDYLAKPTRHEELEAALTRYFAG